MSDSPYPHATTIRRLAAMVYDFFLIVALWMLSTTLLVALFNQGEAITGIWFQAMLLFEVFIFYGFFWHLKGQSLGMQVWKIRTERTDGEMLSFTDAVVRFGLATITMAPFGFGFLWMMIDKDRLTLYDRYSHSRVVYLGSKPYASEVLPAAKSKAKKKKKKKK